MTALHLPRLPRPPLRIVLGGGVLAVALLALHAILAPARADAVLGLPSPGEIIEDGVESAFDFVLKELFGGVPTKLTEAAVTWQLRLPSDAFTSSNVVELNRTTTAAAFALLTLVMTAAVVRWWATGFLDGAGGAEGITGFVRGVAAALCVVAWPWVFDSAITLVNSLTFELISARSVHDDVSRMLGAAVGISVTSGPIGTLVSVVIVVVGTLLMLGLLALHIVLVCALVVMFVAAPLLIVLAPFPGTAWMSALAFRAFITLLAWPVIWAICFACFAAIFNDVISFRGDGGFLDKAIVKPLAGAAMLYLCVRLPLLATKASMFGMGAAGTVGFAARYFAVRQVGAAVDGGGAAAGGSATPSHRGAAAASGTGAAPGGVHAGMATAAGASAASGSAAVGASEGDDVRRQDPSAGSETRVSAAATSVPRPSAPQAPHDRGAAGAAAARPAAVPKTASEAPASLRALGERPRQLEDEMHRARRRAGAPGQPAPATEGDVSAALRGLGREQADRLGNVYDRAISSGRNREEAMAAVTRASAIGAARAETSATPADVRAFRTIGSAPPHAFSAGLEAVRSEQQPAPSERGRAVSQPIVPPGVPHRQPAPARRPGGVP